MNIVITIFVFLITIIFTYYLSRHYFSRTIGRSLTPFVHIHSESLAGIDPEVREDIKIYYKTEEVSDLTRYQIIIANTGDRSIRDFIKPLTIIFPAKTKILDASILHKFPKELEIDYKVFTDKRDIDKCEFNIPLLNKNDFFLVNFLLKGQFEPHDPEFRVTVDDVPPRLSSEWLPSDATTEEKAEIDWSAIIVGLLCILTGISITYLGYFLWESNQSIFPIPWSTYQFSFFNAVALLLSAAIVLVLEILGIINDDTFEDFKERNYHNLEVQYLTSIESCLYIKTIRRVLWLIY